MGNTMNRRQFTALASLAGMTAAASPMRTCLAQAAANFAGGRDLMTQPIDVPHDFVGMHFHHWPMGNPPSPAPTYGYGMVRSHDTGIAWDEIHVAPGQFHWDRLDRWVDFFASKGKTLIYTVYGTPEWASSQPDKKDAYGKMGAGAPPRDMGPVNDFVQALVGRYNTKGHRQIQFIETWNEPHFNGRGFWWGNSGQLVELQRAIYTAAKATDPGIKVMSAGFDGLPPGHLAFNTTGIPAGLREFFQQHAAETPGRWFDAFAVHTYNADVTDPTHGVEGILLQLRETLQRFNVSVPVYTTELGYTQDNAFARLPVDAKASALRRQAAVQAALGVKAICFYSHDDVFCGDPSKNPQIATAINDLNVHLAGQTLQQVRVMPGGGVQVRTQAGSFSW